MGLGVTNGKIEAGRHGVAGRKSLLTSFLSPTAICLVILACYMLLLIWSGSPLNGDADDIIKLHELRTFIATGNVFDRTLPDILQPEPYISHWPWIIDLPYALVAWPLAPMLGAETALSVASFAVPLLLLVPALYFYSRLIGAVGLNDTVLPLFVAVIVAAAGFFEFAPYRIDYHNLQILLFFAALVLALSSHRMAAAANGLVVSLALAVSFEFALFHALVVGIYAFDFVVGHPDAERRLRHFGGGLACGALLLFIGTVPPSAYAIGKCDTYSAPYALALVLGGIVFVGLSLSQNATQPGSPDNTRRRQLFRALALCGLAAISLAFVLALYPQCAGGPYGEMSPRLHAVALGFIAQERSFLERPDFVLSDSLLGTTLLFVGALAPVALCLVQRRPTRALVIVALACTLALIQTVAYFRYLRYLPFFSGIGLVLIAAALLPPGMRHVLASRLTIGRWPWHALLLAIPGLGVTAALVLFCLIAKPAPVPVSVFNLTSLCSPATFDGLIWPDKAIVLAPPPLGAGLLAKIPHPAVIAVPNHPAAAGMERVDRFLDPGEDDPRKALDESRATHVMLCGSSSLMDPAIRNRFSFTVSLMEGASPAWLMQCPVDAASPIRVYSYRRANGFFAACPSLPGG